ncbi:MAG: undecaprenyl/decaprenyl-phosphate alpha-N-acetylglucosaminyl 1-phosphate transferase [Ruminococcaceae bacterium]|nr:undecaprenyl/decaprenyl-phosphate alpha-N-acetylglucosaminyl 1-phosphate transferase [Oscillospiraceae bacterium]
MDIKTLVLCFSIAFAISLAATPFVKNLAYKIGAVDVPDDERRIHKKPIPRLGGLAIFYGFLIAVLCFAKFDQQLKGIIIGSLIIVGVSIIDDVKQLRALIKLVAQILAALVAVVHNVRISAISVPGFISETGIVELGMFSIPVTVIWIIAVTNAVNLIDGLDGLAVGVSSIASFSLFFIAILGGEQDVAIIAAALAGGCLGFMPYNFNPAKIFMGDTGSQFLGYMLSVICIQGLFKGYAVISFIVPFLIMALPLFDTCFAIIRRAINHKPIMGADRGHLHHRLLDSGFSQKETVAILYVITTILGLSAVLVLERGSYVAGLLLTVAVGCAFGIYKLFRKRFNRKRAEALAEGEQSNTETK